MKAKSYFNDFWVGLVKNWHVHLVHETLKSAEYRVRTVRENQGASCDF